LTLNRDLGNSPSRFCSATKEKKKKRGAEKCKNKGHVCCEMETITGTYFPHSCRSLWQVVAA